MPTDETSAQSDRISPDGANGDRPADKQDSDGTVADETTMRSRVSAKRPAETEADDLSRGDRADWRNLTEASSANQAPGPQAPTVVRDNIGVAPGQVVGDVISDDAAPDAKANSGVTTL